MLTNQITRSIIQDMKDELLELKRLLLQIVSNLKNASSELETYDAANDAASELASAIARIDSIAAQASSRKELLDKAQVAWANMPRYSEDVWVEFVAEVDVGGMRGKVTECIGISELEAKALADLPSILEKVISMT